MLRRLYDWVMRLAGSRHAGWALAAIAFAESSFFPIPPDTMLAPMVVARPERVWRYAAICAGASILGGLLGYAIGYSLEPVGRWILAATGHAGGEQGLRDGFARYGVGVILLQGLMPVPYKLITITTGLAHFPVWQFLAASTVTRSARFFGVAALSKRFGPALLPVIERRLLMITTVIALVIIALIVGARLLGHH